MVLKRLIIAAATDRDELNLDCVKHNASRVGYFSVFQKFRDWNRPPLNDDAKALKPACVM